MLCFYAFNYLLVPVLIVSKMVGTPLKVLLKMIYRNVFNLNKTIGVISVRQYANRNTLKLSERGLYQDIFPAYSNQQIVDLLNAAPQTVYAGFDPTADSLHIGNLLVLISLIHWQKAGHNVIALIGEATAQIGDPSGKSSERQQLSGTFIARNVESIRESIRQIFENHENLLWKDKRLPAVRFANNEDWYSRLNAVELVGQVGRHFRMGTMLSRHSVKTRLESEAGMSFTEFCYQIFQAYDWLHLLKKYNCRFQIGGNDQMGNIMSGQELISRAEGVPVYGLTLPLVTNESGDKLGKSAGNAIWLRAGRTSPFEFYQFFVRTKDTEVEKLLKLYTFMSAVEISSLMKTHQEEPGKRRAQKKLAQLVTLLVHGEAGLRSAEDITRALYNRDLVFLGQMTARDLSGVFDGSTSCELLLQPDMTTLQLAMGAGCFSTERDAVRIMTAGGFYINYQRVTNCDEILRRDVHVLPNNVSVVRVGKKNHYIVRWLN
ncbi:tyrosine--tRNA ligase, mitochondrial [Anabrus simplex]|uniref:tyrosine--tRNA ligase, mitochondrial n=1 Tax=Anabrus simplex TaxID=316456 RepID=UPI0034DCFF97